MHRSYKSKKWMLHVSCKKHCMSKFPTIEKQKKGASFQLFRGKGAPPEQVNQFDCQFESGFHPLQTPQQVGKKPLHDTSKISDGKKEVHCLSLSWGLLRFFWKAVWGSFKKHLFGPFFWGMEKKICGKMTIDVIWVQVYNTNFTGSSSGIPCEVEYFGPQQLRKKLWFSHLVSMGHFSQEMTRTILLIGSVGVWSWLTHHSLLKLIAKAPEKWWQTETIWLPFGIRRVFFVKGDVTC